MEARPKRAARMAALMVFALVLPPSGAIARGVYRTANFEVRAATPALARELAEAAEDWREKLAIEWLGKPLPAWTEPCKVNADVHPRLGAGGWTTFVFDQGEVFGWDMHVQGSHERVIDSVLPHEITHTVFASYFRQPLPRWADEGACTTVEHRSEIGKQEALLVNFLKTGKGIRFSEMFAMREYPEDVLPLYAQGLSLTQFLIERRGRQEFLAFLSDGLRDGDWRRAIAGRYGHASLYELQEQWLAWVKADRPRLPLDADVAQAIAAAPPSLPRVDPNVVPASAALPTRPDPGPHGARPLAMTEVTPEAQGPRSASRPSVYEVTPEARAAEGGVRDAAVRSDQPTLLR
ncbi:hypothetical protein [Botrimarina hoheduenensis]|uniref:Peptidase MA-like domain-containing protein n=1 Tax=Botrimarina hoheduenensis TaxID=2528000 RepID=A0A5C5WF88_9BACT|nr:hypothetical protein [Botrimarina hoheduenensis]TWT48759.1 hypothetical protein Pla111_05340 [Botrimarina hoheduenensis]